MITEADDWAMSGHKGMLVDIYKPADGTDCTLRGVTSRSVRALLIAGDEQELTEVRSALRDKYPILILEKDYVPGYVRVVPVSNYKIRWTFGGNFIYSSDSRFPSPYPIPVHDRQE